ncbi:phosphoribosylglycinamide formyltransferase [Propylenella binzhouense]|uniref:Phosphoribosylglycinamide formyltransferase n=1 Tax=Propylenella binzhouense TaxID=2555902 RepID=A0A964T4R7_9HYPH|nr:phosphoribosylglycinamide formyltransferase [Propylenella binzhouense]MYZ48491.1 phosphoribosylglycinamide formyltransferase [Propylenella binzhouense]
MARVRTAVLISGRGSNLSALLAAARDPAYPAEVALVLSNRPEAAGLRFAAAAGVPAIVIDHRRYPTKADFEADIQAALDSAKVEIVCLAGFMRLLSDSFVARWRDRMINIHPSLLPAFRGLDTHQRALEAGVRIHGATVHFVRPEVDSGPIIAQVAVPVLSGDDAETLAARVLAAEHRLYPQALALVARKVARVVGERVLVDAEAPDLGGRSLLVPDPSA